MHWYPPLWGLGMRVLFVDKDITHIEARLKLKWYNRNGYGTHFGGSLLSMTDPFFALILHANLGDDYIIWDKQVEMDFVRASKGQVFATFKIPPEQIASLKRELESCEKQIVHFETDILSEDKQVVAKLKKAIYVKKRRSEP